MANLIWQPDQKIRLGDFLQEQLRDKSWQAFRAAIAFVKFSGTRHVSDLLGKFGNHASISLSVGIDAGGTSAEGLLDLIRAIEPNGDLWVFHNARGSTFHPKIYLFKKTGTADLVLGSGNLTEGGLYTNYEAGIRLRLDLTQKRDAVTLEQVEAALDAWSNPQPKLCRRLNEKLLKELIKAGLVLPEALTRDAEETAKPIVIGRARTRKTLFQAVKVTRAPRSTHKLQKPKWLVRLVRRAKTSATGVLAGSRKFLMTLQNTDVGYGQKTAGTSRRSPEIFIPMLAVSMDPSFWGWPQLFSVDKAWASKHAVWIADQKQRIRKPRPLEKMDRPGVKFQIVAGGKPIIANVWYNPTKNDLRIRQEKLRGAGRVGDLLVLSAASPGVSYDYEFEVVKPSDPRFPGLMANTKKIPNSKKAIGYV